MLLGKYALLCKYPRKEGFLSPKIFQIRMFMNCSWPPDGATDQIINGSLSPHNNDLIIAK